MEAWHIEYTAVNAIFNGTGDPIGAGTTTVYSTSTGSQTITTTTPGTPTSTNYGLDE